MKKLFIAATLLIGMVAGAMVLSSFSEPKVVEEIACSRTELNDGWRVVGTYVGRYYFNGKISDTCTFVIWEKEGMCNAYYWVVNNDPKKNPDQVDATSTGALRKNSENKWCAAFHYKTYIIEEFY